MNEDTNNNLQPEQIKQPEETPVVTNTTSTNPTMEPAQTTPIPAPIPTQNISAPQPQAVVQNEPTPHPGSFYAVPEVNDPENSMNTYSTIPASEGIFTDEHQEKEHKNKLIIFGSAGAVLLIGVFVLYYFLLSPAAVTKRYVKSLQSDFAKINVVNNELQGNGSQDVSSAFQSSDAQRTQDVDALQGLQQIDNNAEVTYTAVENDLSKKYLLYGDAKKLNTQLVAFLNTGETTFTGTDKMTTYLIGFFGDDALFRLGTINQNDLSDSNLNNYISTSQTAETQLRALDPPPDFVDFNKTLTNYVYLNSQIAQLLEDLNQARETGDEDYYYSRLNDLAPLVADLTTTANALSAKPQMSNFDSMVKTMDDKTQSLNITLIKLSSKYKLSTVKIAPVDKTNSLQAQSS